MGIKDGSVRRVKDGESGEVYSITRGAAYHQLLCNVCINPNNV